MYHPPTAEDEDSSAVAITEMAKDNEPKPASNRLGLPGPKGSSSNVLAPMPPDSQSKDVYEENDQSETPEQITDADVDWALKKSLPDLVHEAFGCIEDAGWIQKHGFKSMEKNQKLIDVICKKISTEIESRLVETGRKPPSDIYDQVKSDFKTNPSFAKEVFQGIILSALEEISRDSGRPKTDAEKRREAISLFLKLIDRGANYYQLLNVAQDAREKDIKKAYQKMTILLHPDHNNDHEAKRCTQVLNNIKENLLDGDKRKQYDIKIRGQDPVDVSDLEGFGEGFHFNAFSRNDEESDSDDGSDFEDDKEPDVPPPPADIQALHLKAEKYFQAWFENPEAPTPQNLVSRFLQINKKITKLNVEGNRPATAYQFDTTKLLSLKMNQHQIVSDFNQKRIDHNDAPNRLKAIRNFYQNRCAGGHFHWPNDWAEYIIEPVRKVLGIDDEAMTEADPKIGSDSESLSDAKSDSGSDVSMHDNPIRPVQLVMNRPGYTILGDRILAYEPIKRRLRSTGEESILGFRFFVQCDGGTGMKYATGSDIGHPAAIAYHRLPEKEKNDVRDSSVKYEGLPMTKFGRITGAATRDESGRDWRLCDTWVNVQMNDGTPQEVNIMPRTTLRAWMGPKLADKLIDGFFHEVGVTPPWADTPYPDPANGSEYLKLHWPAPRANKYRQRALMGQSQPSLPAWSDPSSYYPTRSNTQQLPSVSSGGIDDLTKQLKQLTVVVLDSQKRQVESQKQQEESQKQLALYLMTVQKNQEERDKRQEQFLKRLLPSS
ncbi:hypothetical protein B0T10DRAFT_564393 [Thelonectria olida]|uniref:J domain-containing protein n=1 Tax=Thelonectria olida TaxID=1576542 RepID=A0A9P8W1Z8_9HYPO|nr:hypothetical protein B0T10DRAFT_564393 [Thelonectria olida]